MRFGSSGSEPEEAYTSGCQSDAISAAGCCVDVFSSIPGDIVSYLNRPPDGVPRLRIGWTGCNSRATYSLSSVDQRERAP